MINTQQVQQLVKLAAQFEELVKLSFIRKLPNGKWRVLSKKKDKDGNHKNLGTYDTEAEAKKRLKQVEFFKHQ